MMSITKLKLGIAGAVAVAVATPLIVQHQTVSKLREENQTLQQQQVQATQLAVENERLSNQLVQANSARPLPEQQARELLRLRSEVGLLRQQSKELARVQEENRELRARPAQQLAAVPSPKVPDSPEMAARNACINNLRQIEGAMQQCALENKMSPTNIVTAEQILPYLKGQEEVFRCPSGGTYTFGSLTNAPTCSIPGHAIPTEAASGP
jgi:hypothetical protein